jgi:hypothetical protein
MRALDGWAKDFERSERHEEDREYFSRSDRLIFLHLLLELVR